MNIIPTPFSRSLRSGNFFAGIRFINMFPTARVASPTRRSDMRFLSGEAGQFGKVTSIIIARCCPITDGPHRALACHRPLGRTAKTGYLDVFAASRLWASGSKFSDFKPCHRRTNPLKSENPESLAITEPEMRYKNYKFL